MDTPTIIKIFFLTTLAFVITIAWTPLLTHFLYKYKLGKQIRNEKDTPIYSRLHAHKKGTPTMGGILVWGTTLVFALVFSLFYYFDVSFLKELNFLSRSQTLLPLGALVVTALVGLLDDLLGIFKIGLKGQGLRVKHRLVLFTLIAMVGAWWFYYKLDWDLIHVPFVGNFEIGWWYIPVFIFIVVATSFSINQTDGLDGLAGGVLLFSFGAYAAISFAMGRYDLAVFCGVISGGLLAFLWFNINPARFFMGDTGSMSLGVTLAIVALLTNYALLLPIIAFIPMLEMITTIIQMFSKKVFKRKVFLSSPLHHHLEAKKWPEGKIVMRFWIVSGVMAVIGVVLFLVDKGL